MEITNITLDSIIKYFNIVSKVGYKSYEDVYKVIILLFIEELLTSDFSYFINEEDYKTICNSINCLLGSSCLINMPLYITQDSLIHEKKFDLITRITEDYLIRITEDNNIRIKSTPICNKKEDININPDNPIFPDDSESSKDYPKYAIFKIDSKSLDNIIVNNKEYKQSINGNPIVIKIFDD